MRRLQRAAPGAEFCRLHAPVETQYGNRIAHNLACLRDARAVWQRMAELSDDVLMVEDDILAPVQTVDYLRSVCRENGLASGITRCWDGKLPSYTLTSPPHRMRVLPSKPRAVQHIGTYCLYWSAGAIAGLKVAGYEPDLNPPGVPELTGWDTHLGWAMREAGQTIVVHPGVNVTHCCEIKPGVLRMLRA